jgi:hypothetical protein
VSLSSQGTSCCMKGRIMQLCRQQTSRQRVVPSSHISSKEELDASAVRLSGALSLPRICSSCCSIHGRSVDACSECSPALNGHIGHCSNSFRSTGTLRMMITTTKHALDVTTWSYNLAEGALTWSCLELGRAHARC